jgi:hypothetical protein
MTDTQVSPVKRRKGFFASFWLAFRIAVGGLRLLRRYPHLLLPLLPTFVLVFLASFSLLFIQSLFVGLLVVFAVAYAMMFSFAITSHMLKQIEEGVQPSIFAAIVAPETVYMIPRVLVLSAIWYLLVGVLVIVETLLKRVNEDLADLVVRAVLGTVADALRMAGFMLVAIMTFEDVGLRPATGRLRAIVSDSPVTALGGLALTKMVSLIAALVIMLVPEATGLFVLIPLAVCWIMAIYLEQIFVTSLYLYTTIPDGRLMGIVLEDFIGAELPALPPVLQEQPLV